MMRLKGVLRIGTSGVICTTPPTVTGCGLPPPIVTISGEGCQSSSTHTQQLGSAPPLPVLPSAPVVSAVLLPVRFFQVCERLSHWEPSFHSLPSQPSPAPPPLTHPPEPPALLEPALLA